MASKSPKINSKGLEFYSEEDDFNLNRFGLDCGLGFDSKRFGLLFGPINVLVRCKRHGSVLGIYSLSIGLLRVCGAFKSPRFDSKRIILPGNIY
jgi:hypothetical protein